MMWLTTNRRTLNLAAIGRREELNEDKWEHIS